MIYPISIRSRGSDGLRQRPGRRRASLPVLLLAGIAVSCLLLSAPAGAGTKYMAGSPQLSAYISGTNEFAPGDQVAIPVTIENSGVNEFKFIQSGTIDQDDLPNTAKFLTVTLLPGSSPLIIKSDPQMLGDLKGGMTATGVFTVKIPSEADAGVYTLPLILKYSYLYHAEQYGTDTVEYTYKDINKTVSIPITIKPRVRIKVISSEINQVNAGTEGTVLLSVQNIGHEDGRKAVLTIARDGTSPVTPTQSSVYIGDLVQGQTVTGTFRVLVAAEAEEQVYPLKVYVTYEDSQGDSKTSDSETIGIPVGRKVAFSIISSPAQMLTGQKKIITVQYRNTGGATVYNAQARISAVDPFTCSDDVAFLGTVAPGEVRDAMFEIGVDNAATPKEYGLDSEIRYRDSLDNSMISDPLKVRLIIGKKPGVFEGIAANPVLAGILAVLVIGGIAGYFLWYRKRPR